LRTAVWLYVFLFVAVFDLHAQYPVLSPFALSLGATPAFVGLMMGVYSLTHLPGNLIAGPLVDRFGGKPFVVGSLVAAGVCLWLQSRVAEPWQLLAVRAVAGFVIAFLSPACLAMLAKLSADRFAQGKLMAGNGLVHTLAAVVSPAAGAMLAARFGFEGTFAALGLALVGIGVLAALGIPSDAKPPSPGQEEALGGRRKFPEPRRRIESFRGFFGNGPERARGVPPLFYLTPAALACSQGILYFELPLSEAARRSLETSGALFSLVSVGAFVSLALLFLNRYSPYARAAAGGVALALTFYGMAIDWPVPLAPTLVLIGMAKGVLWPAMTTHLLVLTDERHYGRAFAALSVASSVGAFVGPLAAANVRDDVSPFWVAFLLLLPAIALLPGARRAAPPIAGLPEKM